MNDTKLLIDGLRPIITSKAQEIYDAWAQDDEGVDPELGGGGICYEIASMMSEVIAEAIADIELLEGGQDGDDHAWIIVLDVTEQKAYGVDIPPQVYETGGGFSWRKKKGEKFWPEDFQVFYLIDLDFHSLRSKKCS